MRIKILGTRGEIELSKPQHHNHSGILFDETILCDAGEKNILTTIQNSSLLPIFTLTMLFLLPAKKQLR